MADLTRTNPQTIVQGGTKVQQGFINDDLDIKNLYALMVKQRSFYKGTVAPSSPNVGDHWQDSSTTPNVLKEWDGDEWIPSSIIPTSLPANGGNADTLDTKHADDFAPRGYGLGVYAPLINDANNSLLGGYCCSTLNNPPVTDNYLIYTTGINANFISQIAKGTAYNSTWTRTKDSGIWSSWKQLANTDQIPASYDAAHSFVTNGYQKLSNGWIAQWGNITLSAYTWTTVTLPVAFPNACLNIIGNYSNLEVAGFTLSTKILSASQIQLRSNGNDSWNAYWIAIGN